MLPVASWFHAADRSLMRFYGGHKDGPFFCPPRAASLTISVHEEHVRRRTRTLTEAGFLEKNNTSYRITDLGMEYVRGEMTEDELEALNPNTPK